MTSQMNVILYLYSTKHNRNIKLLSHQQDGVYQIIRNVTTFSPVRYHTLVNAYAVTCVCKWLLRYLCFFQTRRLHYPLAVCRIVEHKMNHFAMQYQYIKYYVFI